jgi:hypothetical protein
VIAFTRDDHVLSAFNPGPRPVAWAAPWTARPPRFAERASLSADEVWLAPWGWAILER